jgi:hypothetical protein
MPDPISVGQILLLRDGFRNVAEDPQKAVGSRKHARTLVQLLDELIERREREAGNAASA